MYTGSVARPPLRPDPGSRLYAFNVRPQIADYMLLLYMGHDIDYFRYVLATSRLPSFAPRTHRTFGTCEHGSTRIKTPPPLRRSGRLRHSFRNVTNQDELVSKIKQTPLFE